MQWVSLAIVGVGIGLLTGLSVSPVLSVVLTSLVAAAATVTAVLGRFDGSASDKDRVRPRPAPLALLVVTILLGAILGMVSRLDLAADRQAARLRGLELAPPDAISESIDAWEALGLDRAEVTQNLFDVYLGVVRTEAEKTAETAAGPSTAGFFNALSGPECERLRNTPDGRLRTEMRAAGNDRIAMYGERIEDVSVLRIIVEVECPEAPEESE